MTFRERLTQNPAVLVMVGLLVAYAVLHTVLALLSTGAMAIVLGGIAVAAALLAVWGFWMAVRE